MDNGSPWGSASSTPTALGLWLVGLGVGLIYGRPARSTDNAVVERSHGVLAQWVEPDKCADFRACQAQLDWAVHTQRERYRLVTGRTRAETYPGLIANLRGYDPANDSRQWSFDRVRHYLSGFKFQRKVECNGRITLFANTYSVGRAYARQTIVLQFDDRCDQWVMLDDYGHEIRRHAAKELGYALISQLQLAKRRRD